MIFLIFCHFIRLEIKVGPNRHWCDTFRNAERKNNIPFHVNLTNTRVTSDFIFKTIKLFYCKNIHPCFPQPHHSFLFFLNNFLLSTSACPSPTQLICLSICFPFICPSLSLPLSPPPPFFFPSRQPYLYISAIPHDVLRGGETCKLVWWSWIQQLIMDTGDKFSVFCSSEI